VTLGVAGVVTGDVSAFAVSVPADSVAVSSPPCADALADSSGSWSGGGGMPGARVNFGDGASAATAARPTTARPVAGAPPPAASSSTGLAEVPADPDFACVSVIN